MIEQGLEHINFDNLGAIKDEFDGTEYQWSEIAGHLAGTSAFDWTTGYDIETKLGFKLNIKNQYNSSSCGGQGFSRLMEAVRDLNLGTQSAKELSAKFLYSQCYVTGGGSSAKGNLGILQNQGDSSETLCPSTSNNTATEVFLEASSDITTAAKTDAEDAKLLTYSWVDIDIDSIAQAVAENGGVVIGVYGVNNGTWLSSYPTPPTSTTGAWAHWLYVGKAKLINGKKYLGFCNSWGSTVGDKGWQWISEDYIPYIWSTVTLTYTPPIVSSFSHTFSTTLKYGQTSMEVVALQHALAVDGEFPYSTYSGYYGTITASAVLKFQQKYGVASPSVLTSLAGKSAGPATIAQLNKLFAPKTSPTVVTTPAINTPTVTPTVTTETPKVAWWKKILNLFR